MAATSIFSTPRRAVINDRIAALCKQALFSQALQSFDSLAPDTPLLPSTYALLTGACAAVNSLRRGQALHRHMLNSGVATDVVLNNHFVTMYGKCGSVGAARKVFDEMRERNSVSWSAMIAGYSNNRCEMDAIELFTDMFPLGFRPDGFALANVVRSCGALEVKELGEQLHCYVVKCGQGFELVVKNAMMSMYTRFGCVSDVVEVFEGMEGRDLVSWSSMIAAFSRLDCEWDALCLFKEMIGCNVHCPNEFVFGSVFRACGGISNMDCGRQLHGICLKLGFRGDCFSGCSLCDMYVKCGSIESAKVAFHEIESPDLASWNVIITGLSSGNDACGAIFFFSMMRSVDEVPDCSTISCLISACSSCPSFQEGRQIHSFVLKTGIVLNVQVGNALLTLYYKCSDLDHASRIFEEMSGFADVVSWNALLTACTHHNQPYMVLQLAHRMQISGTRFDRITLNIALCACAILAAFDVGGQVHSYAVKEGLQDYISVSNGLIDMYAKCGFLDDAKKLFKLIDNPDSISWSSLIVGYAQFGCGKEALELFILMQESGVKPNAVTFVGVLSACSRFGLVNEGLQHFNSMIVEHKILPTKELCSCVVDLLAKAGWLEEAESFITGGLFEPDIVMWKTLLAACHIHKHVEIGKRAADNILKLDPSNSAAYVLLGNIYTSTGLRDEVIKLKKLMKSRGIEKTPGQSSIVVGDTLHTFSVEDRSHSQSYILYRTIQSLLLQMRDVGYFPDRVYGANSV